GKDGHPFPVPLETYDRAIEVLQTSLDASKLDGRDKSDGLRRLHQFVEGVEKRMEPVADLSALVSHEVAISRSLGGRTVLDDRRGRGRGRLPVQMNLFQ